MVSNSFTQKSSQCRLDLPRNPKHRFWLGPLAPDIHEAFKGTQQIWPNGIPRFLRLKATHGMRGWILPRRKNQPQISGRTKNKEPKETLSGPPGPGHAYITHMAYSLIYCSLEKSNSTRCIIIIGYSFIDYLHPDPQEISIKHHSCITPETCPENVGKNFSRKTMVSAHSPS